MQSSGVSRLLYVNKLYWPPPIDGGRSVALEFEMESTLYNALIEASSALDGIKLFDVIDSDHIEEVNALLAQIKPVVELTRKIELHRCAVPVRNDPNFFDYHMQDVQRLRNLSRALRFSADVAAFNFEYDDVTRYATVILDLANAVRRGGLVVDHLVALAVAGCGVDCLRKVRERLPDHLRRKLIETLLRYESEREPFSEIAERDAKWEIDSGFEDKGGDFLEENFIDPENELPVDAQRAMMELVKSIGDQPESERQWTARHLRVLDSDGDVRWLRIAGQIYCFFASLVPGRFSVTTEQTYAFERRPAVFGITMFLCRRRTLGSVIRSF